MRALIQDIEALSNVEAYGRVAAVQGLLIEVTGPVSSMSVGARLNIESTSGAILPAEVVGFRADHALCMPFGRLEGVRMGCKAVLVSADGTVRPSEQWL